MSEENREHKLSFTGEEIDERLRRVDKISEAIDNRPTREELPELVETIISGDEFSETGDVVELAVEEGTPLEVVSKIHRDSTWGLSNKLVLHQVSGSNFFDLSEYLGGAGTVFTNSGLTATVNADSTVTIRGTNELSGWNYIINKTYGDHTEKVYPAGTYRIPDGFMMQVRAVQYPENITIAGATENLERTVTIPEDFRIVSMVYAVRSNATVDITFPLGLFRGGAIPETGYEYSGKIYTVEFAEPVYNGEFNWSTGELKDTNGNTVAYYDAHEIASLPGINHFWTGFGENTVSNAPEELEKIVAQHTVEIENLKIKKADNIVTIETDAEYEHRNLGDFDKMLEIYKDGTKGNTEYIGRGENYIPNAGFNVSFPYNGLTVEKRGDWYSFSSVSTTTCYLGFTANNGSQYVQLPEGAVGKTMRFFMLATDVFKGSLFADVHFVDDEYTRIGGTNGWYVARYGTFATYTFVVPSGATQMYFTIGCKPVEEDLGKMFRIYATFDDGDIYTVNLTDGTTSIKITEQSLYAFPYESKVKYTMTLHEFIESSKQTSAYLTPEAFGAKGDGFTDDSQAISDCIELASKTKQTIIMAGNYFTTQPIEVKYEDLNITLNRLIYVGTDAAIKISGSGNTLQIQSITSSADGIVFHSTGYLVKYNRITLNSVVSGHHGIAFMEGYGGIYQNTIHFSYIKAGGDGCYGIAQIRGENTSFVTENNFYGGQISNCDWAVYCIEGSSKLYSIHVEDNVKGGFYINGYVTIFHPRCGEAFRDGEYPFFKIKLNTGREIFKIYSPEYKIPINEFDLSENTDVYIGNNEGQPLREESLSYFEGCIAHPIDSIGSNSRAYYGTYSLKTYFWGSQMIFMPWMDFSKRVTTEEFDTRKIGSANFTSEEAHSLMKLPTKFIVDNVNTTIHLHASYCCVGYSKFEVVQANGFTCKIYNSIGNLIFDGSEYGNGTYRVSVQNDCDLTNSTPNAAGMLNKTLAMEVWNVEPVLTMDILQKINVANTVT